MKKISWLLILIFSSQFLCAQQTVGLFLNDSWSFNGYTLFAPISYGTTYLIDNCGYVINQWESSYDVGNAVYLLENGNLLRTCRDANFPFTAGGAGGRVQEYDWDGNLIWEMDLCNATSCQHHDIEPMPNGNILVLSWDVHQHNNAVLNGRDPSTFNNNLWCEHVMEIQPIGNDTGIVVWQWYLWDHLIQDFDSTKLNYGVVEDHPELLNINYLSGDVGVGTGADWIHANSVDYNPVLDQIMISSRNLCEIYIVDHSTTTAEAETHSGGDYGKGGDLLYRFGNAAAYNRGTISDEIFYGQHDANWIEEGFPDEGKIMVFNNLAGANYSEVEILNPPQTSAGVYTDPGVNAYGPASFEWSYSGNNLYSQIISGAHQLPNGNALICDGGDGRFFEVMKDSTLVWEYINPVGGAGPVDQGIDPAMSTVFRVTRYAADYPAFVGRELTPGNPVELNPLPSDCEIIVDTINSVIETSQGNFFYNNPFHDLLKIDFSSPQIVSVYDLHGRLIYQTKIISDEVEINTSKWASGVYVLQINAASSSITKKLVRF